MAEQEPSTLDLLEGLAAMIRETVERKDATIREKDEAIKRLEHELDLASARIDELTLSVR